MINQMLIRLLDDMKLEHRTKKKRENTERQ